MLHALILSMALAQTVGVKASQPKATLSAAQRTALGNHVASRWQGVVLASIVSFDCDRDQAGVVRCWPTVSDALTAAVAFKKLQAGEVLTPGLAAGAQQRELWPLVYTGANLTALSNLCTSLWPAASGRFDLLHIWREGANVVATSGTCDQLDQAAVWSAFQAGTMLQPCGG